MSTVLVTGATGFVGRALCSTLQQRGHAVCAATRAAPLSQDDAIEYVKIGAIGPATDWRVVLDGKDTVVHLAARVHVMRETATDPLTEFRHVNVAGTGQLARQAALVGVRRFIYVSTIKVNGESTYGVPFRETDVPQPSDPYAASKWEAEQVLHQIAAETGIEVVILRPPLIYGPGVGGNFWRLLSLVDRGFPLPLRLVDNRRSVIYLGNLIDAINLCISHPKATGKTFLVSDCEDVSTPELIRRLAEVLDRPVRLLPFPQTLLRFVGKLFDRSVEVDRLLGSLVIDSSKIRNELGWKPLYTMTHGLVETASWYRRKVNSG